MPTTYIPKSMVPWVVRRVTERPREWKGGVTTGVDFTGQTVRLLYVDGAERDEHGWLWQPTITDQSGAPEWTQVHPERQRRCMDEGRCQVCGEKPGKLLWRIADWDIEEARSGVEVVGVGPVTRPRATTYTPPVCVSCERVARYMCPHLRSHEDSWTTYTAERVIWAGVIGDIYDAKGNRISDGMVRRFSAQANMTLARQRVVRLYGLEEA